MGQCASQPLVHSDSRAVAQLLLGLVAAEHTVDGRYLDPVAGSRGNIPQQLLVTLETANIRYRKQQAVCKQKVPGRRKVAVQLLDGRQQRCNHILHQARNQVDHEKGEVNTGAIVAQAPAQVAHKPPKCAGLIISHKVGLPARYPLGSLLQGLGRCDVCIRHIPRIRPVHHVAPIPNHILHFPSASVGHCGGHQQRIVLPKDAAGPQSTRRQAFPPIRRQRQLLALDLGNGVVIEGAGGVGRGLHKAGDAEIDARLDDVRGAVHVDGAHEVVVVRVGARRGGGGHVEHHIRTYSARRSAITNSVIAVSATHART